MHFSATFSILLATLLSTVRAQEEPTPSATSKGPVDSTQFYDPYQGPNVQDSVVDKSASELQFTLSSGNP